MLRCQKDCLLRLCAVAPVRFMDLRSGPMAAGGHCPGPGATEAERERSAWERTFRFAAHLPVRLSFVARSFHCSKNYAKLVGNCKIYF